MSAYTLRAQVERLQAAGQVVACRTCSGRGLVGGFVGGAAPGYESHDCPDCTPAQKAGADLPEPSQWDSPLSEFQEGQWWIKELDHMVKDATPDQKRAVAVVHHMLRAAARAGQVAAPAMVPLTDDEIDAQFHNQAVPIVLSDAFFAGARAAEAHHGIGLTVGGTP